jgi:hypothetical protein
MKEEKVEKRRRRRHPKKTDHGVPKTHYIDIIVSKKSPGSSDIHELGTQWIKHKKSVIGKCTIKLFIQKSIDPSNPEWEEAK